MPSFDQVFDSIYNVRATRDVFFKEALSYDEDNEIPNYAGEETISAKVRWRNDTLTFSRGVWLEKDRASLIIWFKDITGTKTATTAQITEWVGRFKGNIREADRINYSDWTIDGQTLKVRDIIPLERPDGKIYALQLTMEAK